MPWIGPRPATQKQLAFAEAVSRELKVAVPVRKTRQNLYFFLKEHVPKYLKRIRAKAGCQQRSFT